MTTGQTITMHVHTDDPDLVAELAQAAGYLLLQDDVSPRLLSGSVTVDDHLAARALAEEYISLAAVRTQFTSNEIQNLLLDILRRIDPAAREVPVDA